MRVHHLDCWSMCPVGGHLLFDPPGTLVSHCLAIETDQDGVVLVDTGCGTHDLQDPRGRIGRVLPLLSGMARSQIRPAIHQLRELGLHPRDVRHIVVTHLDPDHAGGLSDFPWATVHVMAAEQDAALHPKGLLRRVRYRPAQLQPVKSWRTYPVAGEPWGGFPAAQPLKGVRADIALLPLAGHSEGHACVAVRMGDSSLVHAGDAYFHRNTLAGRAYRGQWFERTVAYDYRRVLRNHAILRAASTEGGEAMRVFCAHDPQEFAVLRAASTVHEHEAP